MAGGRVRAQRLRRPTSSSRALRGVSATTADDVQRVARVYLGSPTIALVLPPTGPLPIEVADKSELPVLTVSARTRLFEPARRRRTRLRAASHGAWPRSPVYTALYDPRATGDLVAASRVRTSYLARVPFANRSFRALAPFYPRAFESFDLSGFDTIVSSTTAWAKGVIVSVRQASTSAISTPSAALRSRTTPTLANWRAREAVRLGRCSRARSSARLVEWDKRAALRPTAFVANSQQRRRSHPRVLRARRGSACPAPSTSIASASATAPATISSSHRGCCRTSASSVRSTRRRRRGCRLLVAGTGPCERALRELRARNDDDDARVSSTMRSSTNCSATRAPRCCRAKKTSGCFRWRRRQPAVRRSRSLGGALETIVEGTTGEFFDRTVGGIAGARLARVRCVPLRRSRLRAHAETFAPERFIERLRAIVDRVRAEHDGMAEPCHAERSDPERAQRVDWERSRSKLALYWAVGAFVVVYLAYDLQSALRAALRRRFGNVSANAGQPAARLVVELRRVAAAFSSPRFLGARCARSAGRADSAGRNAHRRASGRRCGGCDSTGAASRARSASRRARRSALGIAYLLTPSAQGLAYDNFSENVFVPLLAFFGALAVRRRALWPALVLRAAAVRFEGGRDSLRRMARRGVRALVGPAHRHRARRSSAHQRVGLFGESKRCAACIPTIHPTDSACTMSAESVRSCRSCSCRSRWPLLRSDGGCCSRCRCSRRSSSCSHGTTSRAASDRITPRRCSPRHRSRPPSDCAGFPDSLVAMIPCALSRDAADFHRHGAAARALALHRRLERVRACGCRARRQYVVANQ